MTESQLKFLKALNQLNGKPEPEWVAASRKLIQQAAAWLSGPELPSSLLRVTENPVRRVMDYLIQI